MELWVHVSRLLVLHLDSDQWKHFVLNILLLVGGDATHSFTSILLLHVLHTLDCNCTCQNNPRLGFGMFGNLHAFSSVSVQVVVWDTGLLLESCYSWGLWLPFYLGCPPIELWDSLSCLLEPWDSLSSFSEL